MPIIVTGASNGLGAAFVEALRTREDVHIIALDKEPLQSAHSNVEAFNVDVNSEESVTTFIREIKDRPIELVLHSAGIRGLVPHVEHYKPDDVAACETLDVMDVATLTRAFQTNSVGTFLLLRALLPNLRKAQAAKVVVMSSRMGSVGNNEAGKRAAGSAYAYRASKAALNTMVRSFAVDVPGVTFVLCHPGRVETKLVRCKEEGAISAEESVRDMLPLIESWSTKDSGRFFDRFGQPIEW